MRGISSINKINKILFSIHWKKGSIIHQISILQDENLDLSYGIDKQFNDLIENKTSDHFITSFILALELL